MTLEAPWTAVHNTPNKSVRQDVPRLGAVLHHAAMTSLSGLRRLEMGAKQVSSSAIIKDLANEKMMPEDVYRAWSLSSAYWDSALRSIEACNETTAPGWTVTDETHWSMAKAVAYWSEREGWWPHRDGSRNGWTVITHGEVYTIHGASYATACAGGVDAGLVTRRAQELRGGAKPPVTLVSSTPVVIVPAATAPNVGSGIGPVLRSGNDWALRLPTGDLAKYVTRGLISKGRLPANYPNDGDPQRVFEAAVQETLNFSQTFVGKVDGRLERGGSYGIQKYAARFGDYDLLGGVHDGRPEALSWKCFGLGVTRP